MSYIHMWVLKFKGKEEYNIYNSRTIKFKVKIQFYSRNHYIKNKKVFFINSGIIIGEEKNKKSFFLDLKKDKKIENLERNNNFFISIYSEPMNSERTSILKTLYNPKITFLKPVIIGKDGFEEWEIASFNREDLEEIMKELEKLKIKNLKILQFKDQKIKNLMIQSSEPDLTEKQKTALSLAIENNYYGYPRKIKLVELAKIMKISLSTYQFHLAKAEEKIMPFLFKH